MTTKEIHNFNIDNEDIEIVIDFSYLSSVIKSNGDYYQEIKRRLRLGRAPMGELGKVTKSKNTSLETKTKFILILIFQITMYKCKSWTVKKTNKKKNVLFEIGYWKRALEIPWTPRKMNKWVLQQTNSKTLLEAKMTKPKLSLQAHYEQAELSGKDNNSGKNRSSRKRGKPNVKLTVSV